MTRKSLLFVLIFNVLTLTLHAQLTQTIRGTVTDNLTEMPLVGATVVLLNTNPPVGTITEADGSFRLEKVAVGRQGVQVSFIGYSPATLNDIILSSGKELILNVKLEEKVITTQEVVVKAEGRKDRALNEMAILSARTFTIEETQRYAGSLGDPSRMAANFAGVMSVSDQRNDIVIRGNSPMGLLWRMEGVDIPSPNHFGVLGISGGPVSILNNNTLSNSDFITGAFPAEYGNAMSGAFDLRMRSGNNEKREYVGQVGFNGFELGVEGPFKKGKKASYMANYRYSTLSLMNKLGMDFGTGEAIPQYQDLTFKLDFPTSKSGRFTVFGIGGLSYIELLDSKKASYGFGGVDIYFGSDMGVLGFTHSHLFNNYKTRLKTSFVVSGIQGSTDLDSLRKDTKESYPFVRGKYAESKYLVTTVLEHKFNTKNNIDAGIIASLYRINYHDSVWLYKINRFITNTNIKGDMSLFQEYMQWQHKFTDNVVLNSGVHFMQFPYTKSVAVEPRIGLRCSFAGSQSLSVAAGLHSQLQPHTVYFVETLIDTVNNIYKKTNDKLDLSRSAHLVVGYDYLLAENMRLKMEAYYQHLYNIPVTSKQKEYSMINVGDNFYIPGYDSMENKGTGRNYGLELTFEKFFSNNYYFLLTTSLFQSKYKGYDKVERNSAFNGNYVVNALFGYEFQISAKHVLAVDFKTVWAGGKRILPIDLPKSIEKNNTEYDWAHGYENRYDDYFRVNMRICYRLNGKKMNQEWAFDVQNLTNKQNVFMESYNALTQEKKIDYQMGFFPMMTYKIQF